MSGHLLAGQVSELERLQLQSRVREPSGVTREGLANVGLARDDLFASELEPGSYDLVHARFEMCPLGRGEQREGYMRVARPGGTIVLEDWDTASWRFNAPAPALERLIDLIEAAFRAGGAEWEAGRTTFTHIQSWGRRP